jgi:valyl-tRNA synthetase
MELLIKIIRSIRNIRQNFNVDLKAKAEAIIESSEASQRAIITQAASYIKELARVEPLTIVEKAEVPKMAATATVGPVKIIVPLGHLIDVDKTRAKLQQQKEAVLKEVAKVKQTLDNPDFRKRAPAEKVEALEATLAQLESQLAAIESQLGLLGE